MAKVGKLTNDGNMILKGEVGERLPAVTNGLVTHFPFDGVVEGQTFKRNLLDTSQWVVGQKGTQGNFVMNGTIDENEVISYRNPWGYEEPTWATLQNDVIGNEDGGWDVSNIPIDKTKKYRLSVWIKRENFGESSTYFGCQKNTVVNLGTDTVNDNPYFASGNFVEIRDNWVLFVAYIHPHTHGLGGDLSNGMYRISGEKITNVTDFKWMSTATVGGIRSYLYYSIKIDEKQYWARPRFEICDGTESTIQDLLNDRDNIIRPTINSNTTLTNNGIAIEESAVNLWSGGFTVYNDYPTSSSSSLVKLNETYMGQPIYRLGMTVTDATVLDSFKTTLSSHGVQGGSLSWTQDRDFVSSVYWRPVNKQDTVFGGTASNTTGWLSGTTEHLEDGWRRYFRHRKAGVVAKVDSVHHSFYCPSLELNETIYIDVCCPQTERDRMFPTSYVNGSRSSDSLLEIPIVDKNINTNEGSLVVRINPSNNMIGASYFDMVDVRLGTASNKFLTLRKDINKAVPSTMYIRSGATWIIKDVYSHVKPEQENVFIWTWKANGKYTLNVNDTFFFSDNYIISDQSFNNIMFRKNMKLSDVSFYNRQLNDSEIKSLTNGKMSIKSNGDLFADKIIEKPNHIPKDALHIPLDFNGKDRLGLVSPSSEVNTVYEKGAVWVGILPMSDLEFNFNRDYQLDWSKDWSIVYWKKPIGTSLSGLTGYSIESLGSNGNTIGGGYVWFGKGSGTNAISGGNSFTPSQYFDKWQMVSLTKTGDAITIKNWSREFGISTKSTPTISTIPNYFVTQYGYDFKFGYDDGNAMNSWYRDLIVVKRTLTQNELDKMFKTNMSNGKKGLTVNNQIIENRNLI